MDSPYFQKCLSAVNTETQTISENNRQAESQTMIVGSEIESKVNQLESMLRSETTANEELTE